MLARVGSGALVGIDAVVIDVEVDMTVGLPYFNVVGLPDGAVKESKVRVVSALKNSGFELPHKRITVNLAPADLKKEGAAFELPVALGVLAAAKQLEQDALQPYIFGGELSLDGGIRPIRGVLSLAIAARDRGYRGVVSRPPTRRRPRWSTASRSSRSATSGRRWSTSRARRRSRRSSGSRWRGGGRPRARRTWRTCAGSRR